MRMSLKSVKSRRKKRRLFWLSILVLLLLIIFYISKMLGNLFLEYAKTEAFRYATLVINNSVTDELYAKTDEWNFLISRKMLKERLKWLIMTRYMSIFF